MHPPYPAVEKIKAIAAKQGSVHSVAARAGIGSQTLLNVLKGQTEPWLLRFVTVQCLVDAYPGKLSMKDFSRPIDYFDRDE